MTDTPALSDVIQAHPIGNHFKFFRGLFKSECEERGIADLDAMDQFSEEGREVECDDMSLKKVDDAIYFSWPQVQNRITNISFYGNQMH